MRFKKNIQDFPRNNWDSRSIDGILSSIDHNLTARSIFVIDRFVFVQKRIDRCVFKKTYKIFRGHSEEQLRFSIDRWVTLIDRSQSYGPVHLSNRSIRFYSKTHRSMRLFKKNYVLKPQTLVPRNFLGIFRGYSEEEEGFLGVPSE